MSERLYRLAKVFRHYGNPVSLGTQRLRRRCVVTVVDRKTGLRFKCRRGADTMMGESFHSLIYDVPFVPVRPGDTVMDIGANHGFYACRAAYQGAIVHAFEPDPYTFDLLLENIRTNGLEQKVNAHAMAIGSESGETEMFCTNRLGGGMSSIIPGFAASSGTEISSKVKVKVLSFAEARQMFHLDRVRICKIDCEGAELGILASLDADQRKSIDAFAIEYHEVTYKLPQLFDVLSAWDGFHISKVATLDVGNANLNVVRTDALREWAAKFTE